MPARPSFRRSSVLVGLAVAATSLVAIPRHRHGQPGRHRPRHQRGLRRRRDAGATCDRTTSSSSTTRRPPHRRDRLQRPVPLAHWQHAAATAPLTGIGPRRGTTSFRRRQQRGRAGSSPADPTPPARRTRERLVARSPSLGRRLRPVSPPRSTWSATARATLREGTAAPALTNSTARASNTSVDTDDNATDFTATDGGRLQASTPPSRRRPSSRRRPATRPSPRSRAPAPRARSRARPLPPRASSPPPSRPAASTASTSRPAARTPPPAPPTACSSTSPASAASPSGTRSQVSGLVKEFSGLTELDATSVAKIAALPAVVPNTEIPGTACALPGTACPTTAQLDQQREELEGEAFLPTAPMTVTDVDDFGVSSSSFFGEIGIAAGSTIPLVAPTEVIDAQDTAGIAARTAYNDAHRVVLDDGSFLLIPEQAGWISFETTSEHQRMITLSRHRDENSCV